jgi:hypothetical protein
MKRTRHTPERVIRKLRDADRMLAEDKSVAEIAKELGVSENTGVGHRRLEGDRAGKLLSLPRRRAAVAMLCDRLYFSERRACRLAGQHRFTQRHKPRAAAAADSDLRRQLRDIACRKPRWGYRRAHGYLRENGPRRQPQARAAPVARERPAGAAEDAQAPADRGS